MPVWTTHTVYRIRCTVYTVYTDPLYRLRYAGMDYIYCIPYTVHTVYTVCPSCSSQYPYTVVLPNSDGIPCTVYCIYHLYRDSIPYTVCRHGLRILYTVYDMTSMQFTVSVHGIPSIASIRCEPYGSVFDSFTKFLQFGKFIESQ